MPVILTAIVAAARRAITAPVNFFLQEDGASFFLLEDGTSKLGLES